jgi:hypothetical protein
MDNTLTAVSEPGTSALIGKKDVGGFAIATTISRVPGEIPEPASMTLAAIALLAGPYWSVAESADAYRPSARRETNAKFSASIVKQKGAWPLMTARASQCGTPAAKINGRAQRFQMNMQNASS